MSTLNGGPGIVRNGLVLYLDAANTKSYPASGLTWSNLTGIDVTSILTNGPSFSNSVILLDGNDDYISTVFSTTYSIWSCSMFLYTKFTQSFGNQAIFQINTNGEGKITSYLSLFHNVTTAMISGSGSIYIGGQFGGYQSIEKPTIVAMSSTGSILSNFNASYTDTSVFLCTNIIEVSDGIFICGTNIGDSGIRKINKITGASLGGPPTSAGGAGGSITNYMLIDEPSNSLWSIGSWGGTYQSVAINGIFKMNLTTYAIDATFSTATGFNAIATPTRAVLDSNKDIYVIGSFISYKGVSANGIVKIYGSSGSIDTSFNYGTGFSLITPVDIKIQNDGNILIGGNFTSYNGTSVNRIVRLTTTGSIDTSFVYGSGFNNIVNAIAIQNDGNILVGGNFTSYKGTTSNRIIRLTSTGSVDTSFVYGTGFDNYITDIKVQNDGNIIVIGEQITSYNNTSFGRGVIRLTSTGSIDSTFISNGGFNLGLYRDNIFINTSGVNNAYTGMGWSAPSDRFLWSKPSRGPFYQNKWHQYTLTLDSSKVLKTYIDGVLFSTNSTIVGVNTMRLKPNSFLATCLVNVGVIQFYDHDLTATEVLQNYNTLKKRFTS